MKIDITRESKRFFKEKRQISCMNFITATKHFEKYKALGVWLYSFILATMFVVITVGTRRLETHLFRYYAILVISYAISTLIIAYFIALLATKRYTLYLLEKIKFFMLKRALLKTRSFAEMDKIFSKYQYSFKDMPTSINKYFADLARYCKEEVFIQNLMHDNTAYIQSDFAKTEFSNACPHFVKVAE